jgi:hypothetical protein
MTSLTYPEQCLPPNIEIYQKIKNKKICKIKGRKAKWERYEVGGARFEGGQVREGVGELEVEVAHDLHLEHGRRTFASEHRPLRFLHLEHINIFDSCVPP